VKTSFRNNRNEASQKYVKSLGRFIGIFSLFGLSLPLIFTLIWTILEKTKYAYGSLGNGLATLELLIWPSSIFMMATAGHHGIDYGMLSISVAANIVLYSIIGFVVWLGLKQHRWLLYFLVMIIILGWYKLLTL